MKIRILWLAAFLTPLVAAGTANAFFDLSAPFQRAVMIANQASMISNQITSLATMNSQLTKLGEQFDHIKQQALGQVSAISEPFTDLAAIPGQLVGTGLTWKSDFAGTAGELVTAVEGFSTTGTSMTTHWRDRLTTADTTSEQDVLTAYANLPLRLAEQAAANYRRDRERGEQQTVMNYAVSDAAAQAAVTIRSALEAYDTLRTSTNMSNTALAQAHVAGLLTQGEVMASLAQLQMFQAAQDATEALDAEQRRREYQAARLDAQRRGAETYRQRVAGIASRSDGGDGLRLRVHALYGGN